MCLYYMTQIFGEIDSVNEPKMFTPWFYRHLTNCMSGFFCVYLSFIFLKYLFRRYTLKNNVKQYTLILLLFNWGLLNIVKPSKVLKGNQTFAVLNTFVLFKILNKYYLGQTKNLINKQEVLDKYLSKKSINKYNIQPYNMENIFYFSLEMLLFLHTVYEWYTAGHDGTDSWSDAVMGSGNSIDPSHKLSNSYLNSIGDTIGGGLGCFIVIVTIRKYGLSLAGSLALVSSVYTGPAIIEYYKQLKWEID